MLILQRTKASSLLSWLRAILLRLHLSVAPVELDSRLVVRSAPTELWRDVTGKVLPKGVIMCDLPSRKGE
jgi:hypothetical protein